MRDIAKYLRKKYKKSSWKRVMIPCISYWYGIFMAAKILVVDDEPQFERLIQQRFRKKIKSGALAFSFAQNGEEALQKIEQSAGFDIVLSDINMPKMDGLTFIAELKKMRLPLKTIIVSAYGDLQNIRTAMNRGAYDFVTKPIDFDDLNTTLEKALQDVTQLKTAIKNREQLAVLKQELYVANEIQQAILPKNFPLNSQNHPVDIYAKMIPAKEVGGDFYDYFEVDEQHIGVVIGDVSGKGVAAALFMAIARTLLKATATNQQSPQNCFTHVNHLLSQDNPRVMFVTLFYGVLNTQTGLFTYCNGGHNAPFLINGNTINTLNAPANMALGVEGSFNYVQSEIKLNAGDRLLLFTDGITEALNPKNEEFGDERLRRFLGKQTTHNCREIIDNLIKDVHTFAQGAEQSDDITTLSIRYK